MAFQPIADRFNSLRDINKAIRLHGVETGGLIFGIDYTLSNKFQGKRTFDGLDLHTIEKGRLNPYQEVICILGETLASLSRTNIILAFGFGDNVVKDRSVFPLKKEGECDGFSDVLEAYNKVTPDIQLGGPTNFAPLIKKAIDIVNTTKKYHILVIVADGQVSKEEENVNAIVEASNYALSIIVIGVGDGPWETMHDFDDNLPTRRFDNFQFVDFHKIRAESPNYQTAFALAALMEIPDQYKAICDLGLLR